MSVATSWKTPRMTITAWSVTEVPSSVPTPDEAYEAADRWLANKSDDDDLLGAIDVAAPYIDRAARIDELKRWAVDVSWDGNQTWVTQTYSPWRGWPNGEGYTREALIDD